MFKVNNKDIRRRHWRQASLWCLYCKLSTYLTLCSSVSIVNFEHIIAVWDWISKHISVVLPNYTRITLNGIGKQILTFSEWAFFYKSVQRLFIFALVFSVSILMHETIIRTITYVCIVAYNEPPMKSFQQLPNLLGWPNQCHFVIDWSFKKLVGFHERYDFRNFLK